MEGGGNRNRVVRPNGRRPFPALGACRLQDQEQVDQIKTVENAVAVDVLGDAAGRGGQPEAQHGQGKQRATLTADSYLLCP